MPEINMETDISLDFQPVELQPFIHQVGGHTSMFRFNENTVCKPLCSREYQFYHSLPPELHPFTPQVKGSIEVQLVESSDGYVTFIGYPTGNGTSDQQSRPPRFSPESINTPTSDSPYSWRLLRSNSVEDSSYKSDEQFCESKLVRLGSSEGVNPWSLNCRKRQLAKMRKAKSDCDTKFILLENVAAKFTCPCVLDLKMGTRQHCDDAPESKKQSQTLKCKSTTSAAIGLRICGMQVYQTSCGKYICYNKYHGRSLGIDGFKEAVHQFLHNGHRLRVDVVELLLTKLRELYGVVEKQETFRFYSSSLLIMYDGTDQSCVTPSTPPDLDPALSRSNSQHLTKWPSETDNAVAMAIPSTEMNLDNHIHHEHSKVPALVDVRMIDFANATHKEFLEDRLDHPGPDRGYLFGLENLIKLLEEILQNFPSQS